MAKRVPLGPVSPRAVLARGLRLRCPRCGGTGLYAGWFRMHERCAACGMRYEREQGYFVGAIYVNYALTAAFGLGGVLLLDAWVGLSLAQQLCLAIPTMLLAPILFFRHARSIWLAIDHLAASREERGARAVERRSRRTTRS